MTGHRLLQGIAHIRIFSLPADWERAAAFYRDLLKLPVRYLDAAIGVAVFECGGDVTLGLEQVDADDLEDRDLVGRFTGVSFRVIDVAAAYERLSTRGVPFDHPPEQMEWGGILAHSRDPCGNTLTLVQEPRDS